MEQNEMTLLEFLQQLATFCPGGLTKEKTMTVINTYQDMLLKEIHKRPGKYNYKRLLEYILKTYQYKNFPSIADLIAWLPNGFVRPYEDFALNGGTVRVRFKTGKYYDFEPYYCKMTVAQIKEQFYKKHTTENPDGTLECTMESVKYFPPNFTLIGEWAYDEETGEKIHESKWKAA